MLAENIFPFQTQEAALAATSAPKTQASELLTALPSRDSGSPAWVSGGTGSRCPQFLPL